MSINQLNSKRAPSSNWMLLSGFIRPVKKKGSCWNRSRKGDPMYSYPVSYGYMGLVHGRWMLFATEAEYEDYLEE